MKIYRRKEFLELPVGTMYCKGENGLFSFGCIQAKTDTCPNNFDWRRITLQDFDSDNGEEHDDTLEYMLLCGASIPFEGMESRDGMFCDDDLFLVYEKNDLESIIVYCNNAIKVCE